MPKTEYIRIFNFIIVNAHFWKKPLIWTFDIEPLILNLWYWTFDIEPLILNLWYWFLKTLILIFDIDWFDLTLKLWQLFQFKQVSSNTKVLRWITKYEIVLSSVRRSLLNVKKKVCFVYKLMIVFDNTQAESLLITRWRKNCEHVQLQWIFCVRRKNFNCTILGTCNCYLQNCLGARNGFLSAGKTHFDDSATS